MKGLGEELGLDGPRSEDYPGSHFKRRAMTFFPECPLNLWPRRPNANIFSVVSYWFNVVPMEGGPFLHKTPISR